MLLNSLERAFEFAPLNMIRTLDQLNLSFCELLQIVELWANMDVTVENFEKFLAFFGKNLAQYKNSMEFQNYSQAFEPSFRA